MFRCLGACGLLGLHDVALVESDRVVCRNCGGPVVAIFLRSVDFQ